jgi:hypothetical protein
MAASGRHPSGLAFGSRRPTTPCLTVGLTWPRPAPTVGSRSRRPTNCSARCTFPAALSLPRRCFAPVPWPFFPAGASPRSLLGAGRACSTIRYSVKSWLTKRKPVRPRARRTHPRPAPAATSIAVPPRGARARSRSARAHLRHLEPKHRRPGSHEARPVARKRLTRSVDPGVEAH